MARFAARDAREATISSSASDEEQRYMLGSAQTPFFGMDALKSPPETPGVRQYPEQPVCHNAIEGTWSYAPRDEPLVTPGLGSFGSDEFALSLQFPASFPAASRRLRLSCQALALPTTPGASTATARATQSIPSRNRMSLTHLPPRPACHSQSSSSSRRTSPLRISALRGNGWFDT